MGWFFTKKNTNVGELGEALDKFIKEELKRDSRAHSKLNNLLRLNSAIMEKDRELQEGFEKGNNNKQSRLELAQLIEMRKKSKELLLQLFKETDKEIALDEKALNKAA